MTEKYSEISFYQAYPNSVPPMRADASALGTMPAKAFQYCESMRTASSFGWYVFPADTLELRFDGTDTYIRLEDTWKKLTTEYLSGIDDWWNAHVPDGLENLSPPFVSSIDVPGYVQIWSGMLMQTNKDWSVLVRPIANTEVSGQFALFEGVVETDRFCPAPLFINIRIKTTNDVVCIPYDKPLFQVQPIHRSCYSKQSMTSVQYHHFSDEDLPIDWDGYRSTIKMDVDSTEEETGRYASAVRRRAKSV